MFFLISHRANDFHVFLVSSVVILSYFALRWYLRERAKNSLFEYFSKDELIESVTVMPALKLFYKWDFIVSTDQYNYVGQFNPFISHPVKITKTFEVKHKDLMQRVIDTPLGTKFARFSPNIHIEILEENTSFTVIRLIDMRYFFRNTFLHQATLVLDSSLNPVEGVFHPYKLSKAIPVAA